MACRIPFLPCGFYRDVPDIWLYPDPAGYLATFHYPVSDPVTGYSWSKNWIVSLNNYSVGFSFHYILHES